MSLAYLGSLTVGGCMPAVAGVYADLIVNLQSQLAAQQGLVLALQTNPGKFTMAGSLAFAQELLTSVQAQIALGVELPSIQVQLNLALAVVAQLQIAIDALLAVEFGTAGVHAYAFDGATSQLGAELGAATSGGFPGGQPTDHANAIVLATSVPAAWAALSKLLKTA